MSRGAFIAISISIAFLTGCVTRQQIPSLASPLAARKFPLHRQVTATVFWVGERGNVQSAWDDRWQARFGGSDDPDRRNGSWPARFVPKENPFYFALPYNDFAGGRRKPDAAAVVPWTKDRAWGPKESMCKNHWIRIMRGSGICYAQWEDVGPFRTDDAAYVFGSAAPQNQNNRAAGLDVSPAVRDYLGLGGMDKVDWQFVEASNVPAGPWKGIVTDSQICWQ